MRTDGFGSHWLNLSQPSIGTAIRHMHQLRHVLEGQGFSSGLLCIRIIHFYMDFPNLKCIKSLPFPLSHRWIKAQAIWSASKSPIQFDISARTVHKLNLISYPTTSPTILYTQQDGPTLELCINCLLDLRLGHHSGSNRPRSSCPHWARCLFEDPRIYHWRRRCSQSASWRGEESPFWLPLRRKILEATRTVGETIHDQYGDVHEQRLYYRVYRARCGLLVKLLFERQQHPVSHRLWYE